MLSAESRSFIAQVLTPAYKAEANLLITLLATRVQVFFTLERYT
jgi:hypothetical protein